MFIINFYRKGYEEFHEILSHNFGINTILNI